ncbi:MAG: DnaD domain protein [Bacilli bacterium]|nr:DnaD domain protein [Bacilli bacterium]
MEKSAFYDAVDWKTILIAKYKDLLLDEEQVMILLMCDYCLSDGAKLVTPDLLCLKMTLDFKKVDQLFTDLMIRGLINIVEDQNKKTITSLENLKKILISSFIEENLKNQKVEAKTDPENQKNIISTFENKFGRPLSFIEIETINSWLDEGYELDKIKMALNEAISMKIKNVRYIDKILLEWRQQEEKEKEGYTTISDKWRSDIEETRKIASLNWIEKNDDK